MARVPGTTRRRLGQVLVGLPVIPDDLDEETKNALALRNATWVDGQCPSCGASVQLTAFPELGLIGVTFQHDPDLCPVSALLGPQGE
jgi:hypothetical protein